MSQFFSLGIAIILGVSLLGCSTTRSARPKDGGYYSDRPDYNPNPSYFDTNMDYLHPGRPSSTHNPSNPNSYPITPWFGGLGK